MGGLAVAQRPQVLTKDWQMMCPPWRACMLRWWWHFLQRKAMMFEVNATNIIARHMWHELQLIDATFVKWIYSHSHGSHNTITKTTPWMIWHMIERWAFPILRPALLHTPKEHLTHVWLVTDTCVHWDYWDARVWMTCQAFMMIWCSALPPFFTNPNWMKQTASSVWTQHSVGMFSRLKQ